MTCTVENSLLGEKIAMEIHDDIEKKGVFKRIIFDFNDSNWTLLMSIKDIKQGTRIGATAMFKDSCKLKKIQIKKSIQNEIVAGMNCRRITINLDQYIADLWITDQFNFDVSRMFELLLHSGLMNPILKKGKWFEYHTKKGMIVKVNLRNKNTDENYSISLDQIEKNKINARVFNIEGYKIADIEEGKNCGAKIDN